MEGATPLLPDLQLPKEKQYLENCRRETVPLWKIGKIEKVQM